MFIFVKVSFRSPSNGGIEMANSESRALCDDAFVAHERFGRFRVDAVGGFLATKR